MSIASLGLDADHSNDDVMPLGESRWWRHGHSGWRLLQRLQIVVRYVLLFLLPVLVN